MSQPPRADRVSRVLEFLRRPPAIFAFLSLACLALSLRVLLFISHFAVNILYWDQWAFYVPLFQRWSPWQLFTSWDAIQHAGLGMLAASILANATGWNSRADAFAVGAFSCLALALALLLKWKIFRGFTYFDLIVPLLFLTLFQYESWVIMPVLWGSALPVVLIMLYCLTLLLPQPAWRTLALLLLNFLMVYTGKAMFMGFITVLLFALELWQSRRGRGPLWLPLIALAAALASDLSFLIGFQFQPGIPNFGFSWTYLAQAPLFVGLMLSAFWGWHMRLLGLVLPAIAGLALLVGWLAIFGYHLRRLVRGEARDTRLSLVIVALIGYSLIFCFVTAVGRIPLGLAQAQVSRYVPLMIPGYFGCYLQLISLPASRLRRLALVGLLVISAVGSLPAGIVEAQAARIASVKTDWKLCYLQLESVQACDDLAGASISPPGIDIGDELAYLKAYRLNLYLDAGK